MSNDPETYPRITDQRKVWKAFAIFWVVYCLLMVALLFSNLFTHRGKPDLSITGSWLVENNYWITPSGLIFMGALQWVLCLFRLNIENRKRLKSD